MGQETYRFSDWMLHNWSRAGLVLGIALLLIEQNVVQSLDVAQRAYILDNGRFVLEGPAAELGKDPKLKHAYLGM